MTILTVAPSTPYFAWQCSLLYYSVLKYSGNEHTFKVLSPTLNHPSDTQSDHSVMIEAVPENLITFTKPFWEIVNSKDERLLPINIPASIYQIKDTLSDQETYCIIDPDMCCYKNPILDLNDFDLAHDPAYENWHIHYNSKNIIYKQFSGEGSFSGFVPIYIKGYALKQILKPWIDNHLLLLEKNLVPVHHWWLGMYSYNIVVNKHNLKVDEQRLCVIPGFENQINPSMKWIHYSIKNKLLDKKDYRSWDIKRVMKNHLFITSDLPEYLLFEIMKEWSNG